MKGLFITFEGVECSGKSIQSKLLLEYCNKNNILAILVREPGGTPTGEQLRNILLTQECTGLTEFFILSASRAHLTETIIKPHLQQGFIVISDRYFHSSLVYQGFGRKLDLNELKTISKIATLNLEPEDTFLLSISKQVAEERLYKKHQETSLDRIEQESLEFHNTIRESYLKIAKEYSYINICDANQTIEEIHNHIIQHLKNKHSLFQN
ncbi:MAG: dTMP kinase [Brevinema sp.]